MEMGGKPKNTTLILEKAERGARGTWQSGLIHSNPEKFLFFKNEKGNRDRGKKKGSQPTAENEVKKERGN